MGQEVDAEHFRQRDIAEFHRRHSAEMELLAEQFRAHRLSERHAIIGLELEAWLIDQAGNPLPENQTLLERLADPSVVPELSKFNIEFNVDPQPIEGHGLVRLAKDLEERWSGCERVAESLGLSTLAIGILPTIEEYQLTLDHLSDQRRYRALNEQVLRLRHGKPLRLDISGAEDHIEAEHNDVMLEAAATSLQLHLQVAGTKAVRYYNASLLAAAPTVAVAANAPFLFGKRLWDDTRIPLFEQAVHLATDLPRVTFGTGYVESSLESLFVENFERYPVILPLAHQEAGEQFAHIKLHNGTIWRWVRPLLGVDEDGTLHLRIEHRVMSAGPTIADILANATFYYGLVEALAQQADPPERHLHADLTRTGFYRCAKESLRAKTFWIDGSEWRVHELILRELLPLAEAGLKALRVNTEVARAGLAIIEARVASGQNGAIWQKRFLDRHGGDRHQLTLAYRERQHSGEPVHQWTL